MTRGSPASVTDDTTDQLFALQRGQFLRSLSAIVDTNLLPAQPRNEFEQLKATYCKVCESRAVARRLNLMVTS